MLLLRALLLIACVWSSQADVQSVDPDVYEDVMPIVWRHGYHCEKHTVETDDGFILTLFRIPKKNGTTEGKPKQPVLLQHGLLADASTWILSKSDSLAFILADQGYDVWMGNYRGSHYSLTHKVYNERQYAFWDWSWDEMAYYDLPKFLEYISTATKQKLLYVGHSMGTTTFYASLSMFPENGKYVKAMFSLAPIGYLNHAKGAITFLTPFAKDYDWISRVLGFGEFIPNDTIMDILIKFSCNLVTKLKAACQNVLFVATGYDDEGFNSDYFPAMISHLPSSTSVRTVIQYSQEVNPGKFQKYDYGIKKNLVKYGTKTPPEYNVTNIPTPIAFYWGPNDWLSAKVDAERLWEQIPNKIRFYPVPSKTFDHMDFMFAKNIKGLLFNDLLKDMSKYSS